MPGTEEVKVQQKVAEKKDEETEQGSTGPENTDDEDYVDGSGSGMQVNTNFISELNHSIPANVHFMLELPYIEFWPVISLLNWAIIKEVM